MSMIGNYRRISAEELEEMIEDPSLVSALIHQEDAPPEEADLALDIDKAWHAIHFLLTGQQWSAPAPLGNAVMGGTEIGEDVGYGPARYLTPEEVADVATALIEIPREDLLERFDEDDFEEAEIYGDFEDTDEDLEYIGAHYEQLVFFFVSAAELDDAMLIYIS